MIAYPENTGKKKFSGSNNDFKDFIDQYEKDRREYYNKNFEGIGGGITMNKQDCRDCAHNGVCSIKKEVNKIREDVTRLIVDNDNVRVKISCKFYSGKLRSER